MDARPGGLRCHRMVGPQTRGITGYSYSPYSQASGAIAMIAGVETIGYPWWSTVWLWHQVARKLVFRTGLEKSCPTPNENSRQLTTTGDHCCSMIETGLKWKVIPNTRNALKHPSELLGSITHVKPGYMFGITKTRFNRFLPHRFSLWKNLVVLISRHYCQEVDPCNRISRLINIQDYINATGYTYRWIYQGMNYILTAPCRVHYNCSYNL